ncbi:YdeI/OmpD-associated family protein [Larkinella sp. VNQ87]|uniref:YdeI/OmpD-associated family protein n=1 Tax=Larkinella sp. VNQ87 TaxID=3400921 RepID=UPI003BFB600F
METHKGVNAFYAQNRQDWRNWLDQNHDTEKAVWLIMYRKTSEKPGVYYDEAVEEALCFGWIDSVANKRDEESFYLYFARRNPKSNWSQANRERVDKLTQKGLIRPAGQAMIDLAKETGTWEALVDVQNAVIPDDLQQLFNQNPQAMANFQAFSPSSKRGILEWILNAKRPETRQKRLAETVRMAEQNKRVNIDR